MILLMVFLFPACSQPLRDNRTSEAVAKVDVGAGMVVFKHMNDNMERGNKEFSGVGVVIDQGHYKSNPVQRGDIVYYKNPQAAKSNNGLQNNEISRVVALPGESIRIEQGQLYINGKKLDTFYGQAHWGGMDLAQLKKQSSNSEAVKSVIKIIQESDETNKQELKIPDGQYYIIGDNWIRSGDSRHFGPISKDSILGKVKGYN
ncbi:signal peptidase I [Paenibacillus aurantius]|uniref:Signal peptidase I n=1 Tax=Paenibacillus aurantius TaxID=2918900 RepID=A0AA96LIY0_9BACL|nr:signal peptidase I [Paenibacillus aurantius]WNQ13848.1 signal peptidase I [Paenibacillus aurantius]